LPGSFAGSVGAGPAGAGAGSVGATVGAVGAGVSGFLQLTVTTNIAAKNMKNNALRTFFITATSLHLNFYSSICS